MKSRWTRLFENLDSIGAAISMTAMMLVSTAQILGRITGFNIVWSIEVNRYLLIYLVFFGLSSAIQVNGHMGSEFLSHWVNEKGKFYLAILNKTFFLSFALLMLYSGTNMVKMHSLTRQMTASLPHNIPVAYISFILPVGFLFAAIHLSRQIWRSIKKELGRRRVAIKHE